jgi:hypothetical protein
MILLLLSIEVLLMVGFLAYLQLRPMVVKTVTMEAGSKMPELKEFLIYSKPKGAFITKAEELNLNQPGIYDVKIKVGNKVHTSKLQIIDTTAPTAVVTDQMILKEEEIKAEALVTDIKDATPVSVIFKNAPVTAIPGDQEVTILLEDSSKNQTELKAVLTVLDIKNTVSVEAGSKMNITTKDFVDNDKYDISFVTDLSKLDISKPTIHTILINVNGREINANIEVIDTKAPKASFLNREIWKDVAPNAMTFVTGIQDASPVTATFKEPPDVSVPGEQKVTVILEDGSGNRTEQTVTAIIKADTEPPKIIGISDKTVYIGDSVAYRKGVTVTDNKDKDLKVNVDSSNVNLKKEGTYQVIYTAQDNAGNKAKATAAVTVVKFTVSEEEVYKKADKILASIIDDSMTKREKAYEIYHFIKSHVGYNGESDKSDWLAEAYRGMVNGVGDCFTYYSVAQALLTRAGIDNMRVTRVGGRTHHYWNLVNCGDGWYHFDSCPHKDHAETFMLTDKEVEEYTKKRGNNYYTFDKSLYPATPEE